MKERLVKAVPLICVVIVLLLMCFGAFMAGYNIGKSSVVKENLTTERGVEVKETSAKTVNPKVTKEGGAKTISVPIEVRNVEPEEPADMPEGKIIVFKPRSITDSAVSLPADSTKDSLHAIIPITQKEYRDSNFTAYVSGYHASLDSIEVKSKVITYTKSVTRFRRWNIGVTGGYGYGFVSHKVEPFIGLGVTWNVFR